MDENLKNDIENTRAQMRKGFLEYCALLVIAAGKVYASDILVKLKDADLLVVEGTIYPLLSRLKNSGLVSYEWEESQSGPPRKYYELTANGRAALAELSSTWQALARSVSALAKIASLVAKNKKIANKIVK
ncbi:MAG: PadR family transcriptional regulator [Planctomycetes bacterium]|jgi:PadR family transcriptional regulator PadR|nr:PadR family transcriptional regulator [Planctomycetota bacterium]